MNSLLDDLIEEIDDIMQDENQTVP